MQIQTSAEKQRPATAQKVAKHTAQLLSAINDTGASRLIDFREVNHLTGSACKTGHNARALARRGQIVAVRLNERVVRYRLDSVLALVRGEVDPVAGEPRRTPKPTPAEIDARLAEIDAREDLNDHGKSLLKAEARRLAAQNTEGAR